MSVISETNPGNTLSKEDFATFDALRQDIGKALSAGDQNLFIEKLAQLDEFAASHGIHLSADVTINPDQPPGPTGDKDQFGIVKIMKDAAAGAGNKFLTDWKIRFFTRHYRSGKPDEPTSEYTNAAGSNHNDGKQAISNQEVTFYVHITKFKNKDDTISVKIEGGDHGKANPANGTCYDCQINVFGGNGNTLEVERPHPSMHPCHQPTKFKIGETLVNKWIGVKMISYLINGGKDRHLEMQLDYPVAD